MSGRSWGTNDRLLMGISEDERAHPQGMRVVLGEHSHVRL
jgi:hypothetical protein